MTEKRFVSVLDPKTGEYTKAQVKQYGYKSDDEYRKRFEIAGSEWGNEADFEKRERFWNNGNWKRDLQEADREERENMQRIRDYDAAQTRGTFFRFFLYVFVYSVLFVGLLWFLKHGVPPLRHFVNWLYDVL